MIRHGGGFRREPYLWLAMLAAALVIPFPTALGLVTFLAAVRGALVLRRGIGVARRRDPQPLPGVLLGRDPRGRAVRLGDDQLAAHALVVGASGSGKSTTMLSIMAEQIAQGRPVVAIDMKGSPEFARQLAGAATAAGRRLRVWTPDGPALWNPLAHGNATALKDMLISTERFSEPHYQRAAERYLQLAFTVLHAAHPGRPAQLEEVVAVMEPGRLAARLREVAPALAERAGDYLRGLTADQESAVRGLGTRLALLSESSAGPFLAVPERGAEELTVDLRAGLEGGDVMLMSLNSSVYGKLAAQLGALAIQDVTSAAGYRLQAGGGLGEGAASPPLPATVAIDEFSALGADNVLSLLARGREAGVTVLLATQELADLERAGRGFRDQVLGITGATLAHRQDVHESATMISQMAGTELRWEMTETVRSPFGRASPVRGTRRQMERPVVHPNAIKSLQNGELMLFAHAPRPLVTRVRVRARRHESTGPGQPARRTTTASRREPPDQAAPGVTR